MAKGAAVIIKRDDKILLAKRGLNQSHQPGKWENVGGKLEEGESFQECVIREVKEEIGVELKDIGICIEYKDQKGEVRITLFESEAVGEPKILEPDSCDELGWFTRSELKDLDLADYTREDFVKLGWL